MPTIYISDSGDDKNDGVSLRTAIESPDFHTCEVEATPPAPDFAYPGGLDGTINHCLPTGTRPSGPSGSASGQPSKSV
jgi:hypothetical protein